MSTEKTSASAPGSFSAALTEAQKIIDAAEQRAKQILDDAKAAFEDAKARGYDEGKRAGQSDALSTGIRMIHDTKASEAALAEEAARLAVAIAGSIIGDAVETTPEIVTRLAERVLREGLVGEHITLVLNPEDEAAIRNNLDRLVQVAGGAQIALETRPNLARGGCIIRTLFGEVDASIEHMLTAVKVRLGLDEKEG